jgi:two-component sensor histidine kinase
MDAKRGGGARREDRFPLKCALQISWQRASGESCTTRAACQDVSPRGAMVECSEPIAARSSVYVSAPRQENGRITLTVEDNGSGFRPSALAPAATAGIGLRSLRDLARELGGDLQTIGSPQGATLIVSFPVIHE